MKQLLTALLLASSFNTAALSDEELEARCYSWGYTADISKVLIEPHKKLSLDKMKKTDWFFQVGFAHGVVAVIAKNKKREKNKVAHEIYNSLCMISI